MRHWIATLLATAGIAMTANSWAWTDKPVKLIVPAPAGGSMDVVARLLAQQLSADIRQPVIVENKAGAGGAIAIQALLQAQADGQTLMVTANNVLVEIPHVIKTPYDPLKDVKPVATFARSGLALVSAPMPGVDDLKGLLGLLKSRQGKASFASYSAGTSSHYAGLILNQKTGLDLQHVPFPGSSPALTQVMGGQIEMMFDGIATSLPFIKAGKLKVYGFTGKRRSPYLPDVPTLTELGYPDIQFMGWLGVIASSALPNDLSIKINAAVRKVASTAAFKERLQAIGLEPDINFSSAQLSEELKEVSGRNAAVVKQFNVKLN